MSKTVTRATWAWIHGLEVRTTHVAMYRERKPFFGKRSKGKTILRR